MIKLFYKISYSTKILILKFNINFLAFKIERDRWKDKEVLQEIETNSCTIDWLEFSLCVREMLGVPGGC